MDYERDKDGYLITKLNGKLHSFNDKPAVINANGDQWWYKEGKCHRDGDLPAIILANGDQFWFKKVNVIEIVIFPVEKMTCQL